MWIHRGTVNTLQYLRSLSSSKWSHTDERVFAAIMPLAAAAGTPIPEPGARQGYKKRFKSECKAKSGFNCVPRGWIIQATGDALNFVNC